ncbi:beta-channel forming cytolysin [Staphylococcus schleiferi subsp. coagulans]|uniref:beta-channel forming cytolysin n=1 Tax=Staphylococcus coagulans TaxID=74706 RepID=UPI0015FD2DD5|nr:beta-channel forming cytolysin [Staphylococcus coagulans]MBA8760796.1 beta-channel forming cytolysin [Staphylococcus coagulans]MBA8769480.1 beta-channel forming cytolysin [Staphylococcus coagulans]
MIKTTILTSTAFLLLSSHAFAEEAIQPVKVEKVNDKTTIYKTTATADSDKYKISQILNLNFIKDKTYDKDTLIVKATGNINSGYQKPDPNEYFSTYLLWGGQYNVALTAENNDSTSIVDYAPKNQNENFQVQQTLTYGGGGDINITNKLSGALNGKYTFAETINYKQENYRTILNRKTNNKHVGWGVEAHKIMNNGWSPYSRDADDNSGRFGNELFMKSRTQSGNAGLNFIPEHQMPLLSRGNFNPEFLGVLTHKEDDKQKTRLKVTYQAETDLYQIHWGGFFWVGKNQKRFGIRTFSAVYEIDWQNHSAKLVEQVSRPY